MSTLFFDYLCCIFKSNFHIFTVNGLHFIKLSHYFENCKLMFDPYSFPVWSFLNDVKIIFFSLKFQVSRLRWKQNLSHGRCFWALEKITTENSWLNSTLRCSTFLSHALAFFTFSKHFFQKKIKWNQRKPLQKLNLWSNEMRSTCHLRKKKTNLCSLWV